MPVRETYVGPPLIRWGAVIAGTVIGLAVMVLLSTLWVAWGEGGDVSSIADNLHWYAFASAVVALLIAGILAGGLSGIPGPGAGLLHGITVWGITLVVAAIFPIPQTLRLFDTFTTPLPQIGDEAMWATFWSLLIGLAAAGVGGIIGGALAGPDETMHRADESRSSETTSAGES
ncbi:hypothetical protein EF847_02700 [Actinobacteria bacterium YIM 96077]|uniref:Uncharacterized protein n=1 Tax=Phytoactinopolyspora halophila TaxID=1981511 RepID=A0A329QZD6_9ACTN|nr:hypothetical protein [Phytoactinopolyspora halophila]AYY11791.1 hypothetical protein EF847_02700 [Actinobacteria bacterium YIM 96077]RAW17774.1 hypothetical protein DPM12_02575 [Phytoactinopolyspora halophila]